MWFHHSHASLLALLCFRRAQTGLPGLNWQSSHTLQRALINWIKMTLNWHPTLKVSRFSAIISESTADACRQKNVDVWHCDKPNPTRQSTITEQYNRIARKQIPAHVHTLMHFFSENKCLNQLILVNNATSSSVNHLEACLPAGLWFSTSVNCCSFPGPNSQSSHTLERAVIAWIRKAWNGQPTLQFHGSAP